MYSELDLVVLVHDVEEYGLRSGDVGTVVHLYTGDSALEIEFVTAEGRTVALLTLASTDVRPMGAGEILHAREMAETSP